MSTKNKKITHRDACFDLAKAKGTQFIEVPLGSVWLNTNYGGQADVITIKPSYTRFNIDIYEVKVQRSDFLQDIKKKKYEKYLPHCNRLYFATLSGVAKKEEIPDGIGLIVKGEKGWTTIKSAKKREIEHSKDMLLSLAFSNGRVYQQRRRELSHSRGTVYGILRKDQLKYFGKEIKEMILKYNDLKMNYRNLLWHASRKIPFVSEKERQEFEDNWENKTNIRKW